MKGLIRHSPFPHCLEKGRWRNQGKLRHIPFWLILLSFLTMSALLCCMEINHRPSPAVESVWSAQICLLWTLLQTTQHRPNSCRKPLAPTHCDVSGPLGWVCVCGRKPMCSALIKDRRAGGGREAISGVNTGPGQAFNPVKLPIFQWWAEQVKSLN